jgi:hypothetical protein
MSTLQHRRDEALTPDKSPVILLLGTLGDTTWRMFFPTIGGTVVGIYGDNILHIKPWLTISGVLIGALIAAFLIRTQLKKVKKSKIS